MITFPTRRSIPGLGEEAVVPVPTLVVVDDYYDGTRKDEFGNIIPKYGTPEWDAYNTNYRARSADQIMSLVLRFPGMFLAGAGQWVMNRTRPVDKIVDPMTYARDEKNKNLTWALALVAWGILGLGTYNIFFKKGGS